MKTLDRKNDCILENSEGLRIWKPEMIAGGVTW